MSEQPDEIVDAEAEAQDEDVTLEEPYDDSPDPVNELEDGDSADDEAVLPEDENTPMEYPEPEGGYQDDDSEPEGDA